MLYIIGLFYNLIRINYQSGHMGSLNSYKTLKQFNQEWQLQSPLRNPKNIPLVNSKTSFIKGQLNQIRLKDTDTIDKQLYFYELRKSSKSGHLVNIIDVYKQERNPFQISSTLLVISERIPYRISQIKNLSTQEAHYIAYGLMCGLSQLKVHIKDYFHISEQMIGINYFGVPKIWHNKNFVINFPAMENPYQIQSDYQMIDNLLRIIESKINKNQRPPIQFTQIRSSQWININGALNMLCNCKKKYNLSVIRRSIILKIFNTVPLIEDIPGYVLTSLNIQLKTGNYQKITQNSSYTGKRPQNLTRSTVIFQNKGAKEYEQNYWNSQKQMRRSVVMPKENYFYQRKKNTHNHNYSDFQRARRYKSLSGSIIII